MGKTDRKRDFDNTYNQLKDRACGILARNPKGEVQSIKMDLDCWHITDDRKGAHYHLDLPPEFGIDGHIVVGLVKEGFNGEALSLSIDRKIHVIKGRVKDPVSETVITENDPPVFVKAGDLMTTQGLENSVIVIQLLPDEK